MKSIRIKGAKVHNLKSVNAEIPKGKLVLITGVSGSGKSSLAFDTIFAEGQRRYVESLSSYARQFLGIMDKPDVDFIEGLSPTIAIEQRGISKNPRSTVATTTEIYDYMRVLFARVGDVFCYQCGRQIQSMTVDEIVGSIMSLKEGTKIEILSPVITGKKGTFKDLFKILIKRGFTRIYADNKSYMLGERIELSKNVQHDIDIIIDRLAVKDTVGSRLTQSVEAALRESDGRMYVVADGKERIMYNESFTCPHCHISYEEVSPRLFSFNTPYGACPDCHGLGVNMEIDPEAVIEDQTLSVSEGAIAPYGDVSRKKGLIKMAHVFDIDLEMPWEMLTDREKHLILYGPEEKHRKKYRIYYEGVLPYLKRLYMNTDSNWLKYEIEKYMVFQECSTCGGTRLNPTALSVKIEDHSIADVASMNIEQAYRWFTEMQLQGEKKTIARELIKEIGKRLAFLKQVGLDYITLDRKTETLSGGEEQRVRLATQIGSGLTGVLYVLDEPSIGLHQRDIDRLIKSLKDLRDLDNTVIIVEHDNEFIKNSDYIIDMGPYAGHYGGEIVFAGTYEQILKHGKSLTGRFVSGRETVIDKRKKNRPLKDMYIGLRGAREHNLKNIDIDFPLGLFICISGVSGSGKSTLVNDILYRAMRRHFNNSLRRPGEFDKLTNLHLLDKVINIDQTPIGRTPRSNPATYTGVYTPIRELFASLRESKMRGYKPGRFSFNVKGGRCEACEGTGLKRIEMHFLQDIYVTCSVCRGKRFNRETLQVKYRGRNISEILDMSVDQALEHFSEIPRIKGKLQLLSDVGLGYIKLGQPATSLSGGEAQRIKLSRELSKKDTGRTLYLLDEPTTGLHSYDVKLLLDVLNKLVRKGNTLIVIEHNLDVLRSSDYIIDLGPEGGEGGGHVVYAGPSDEIVKCKESYTGHYMKREEL